MREAPAAHHFPLALAGVCINCTAVFDLRLRTCPACASESVQSLELYTRGQRGGTAHAS